MDISSSINISKFVLFQVISISINLQLIPQYPAAKWWIYPAPPPGRKRLNAVHARPCRATERRPRGAPLCAPAPALRWLERGKGLRARPTFGRICWGYGGSKMIQVSPYQIPPSYTVVLCMYFCRLHPFWVYLGILSKDVRLRFSETWIQVYDRSRWAISETQGSRKKHQQIHIWEGTILLLTTRLYKNDVYGNFLGYRLKENDVCGYGITFKGGIAGVLRWLMWICQDRWMQHLLAIQVACLIFFGWFG